MKPLAGLHGIVQMLLCCADFKLDPPDIYCLRYQQIASYPAPRTTNHYVLCLRTV